MKKNTLFQTSTLWINILLLFFITQTAKATPDNASGFFLDEGISQSRFKFKTSHNLIIMPVVIDGRKLNLIFDTGMNSIIIFKKNSIKSWKEREKHTVRFSGLGRGNYIKGYRLDGITVKMPKIKGKGLSLVVTPNSPFPKYVDGIEIHGVFGYQLLAKFIVQIDYKNQYITLTDPNYYVPPLNASVIDLKVINTKPYIECPIIMDQKELNLNLLVDTGAEAPLILRNASLTHKYSNTKQKQIGVGLAGNMVGTKVIINDMVLGSHHMSQDFEAWVPSKKSYPDESSRIIRDGTIGGATLKQFNVTFDYFNNKLYLEKTTSKTTFYDNKAVNN